MPFPKDKGELITAGYKYLANKTCPCGAGMELWLTPKGATMPMNPMRENTDPATSHFSDCPMATQFRRHKK
jgi:hypothetical protein